MSTGSYPSIGYLIGYSLAPQAQSARVRVAANGRAHVQHLGSYDDSQVQLVHPYITEAQLWELRQFWDTSRADEFYWSDSSGQTWLAQYASRPVEKHEVNSYWSVTVRLLLRRADQ